MLLALRRLWTVLLPGMIAGFVPWRYFGVLRVHLDFSNPLHLVGLVVVAIGVALLAACIWDFARRGRGTLSPADPPKELWCRGCTATCAIRCTSASV